MQIRIGGRRVAQPSWRPSTKASRRSYRTRPELIIPKAPFERLIKEILKEVQPDGSAIRYREEATIALHEAAEAFLTKVFRGSTLIANHAHRMTVYQRDVQLYSQLCLSNF